MIIDDIFSISLGWRLIQINIVVLLTIFRIQPLLYFLISIRDNFFPIGIDGRITAINFFLQTIIKPSLPQIDNFIPPTSNKIITLPTKLSRIRMWFQGIFQSSFLTIPYLGGSIFWWTDKIGAMWMEINTFDRSLMSFIYLYDMLRS